MNGLNYTTRRNAASDPTTRRRVRRRSARPVDHPQLQHQEKVPQLRWWAGMFTASFSARRDVARAWMLSTWPTWRRCVRRQFAAATAWPSVSSSAHGRA